MRMKYNRCDIAALFLVLLPLPLLAGNANAPVPPDAKALIDKSCAGCHRSPNAPAGLDLTLLSFDLTDAQTFGTWVRIHDAVRDAVTPPGNKNALKPAEREAFLKTIAEPMIAHEHWRAATQGRSMLRRLNRYEYENTVRDLLSAPWLQLRDSLPEDGLVSRFNKVGQALDVSHVQMARYMEAAEQAIRLVLAAADQPQVEK